MRKVLLAAFVAAAVSAAWADYDPTFEGFGAVLPPAPLALPGAIGTPLPQGTPDAGWAQGIPPAALDWLNSPGATAIGAPLGSLLDPSLLMGAPTNDSATGFPSMSGLGFDPNLLPQNLMSALPQVIFDLLGSAGTGAGAIDWQSALNVLGPLAAQSWGVPTQTPSGAPVDPGVLAIQGFLGYGQALNDLLGEE